MASTINDVARLAGVSKSTVSKVLNNRSSISPATVERVKQAIKELNYTPNSRAVSFARRSTKNIIYLTNLAKNSAYQNPHMFDIMCGVHKALSKKNFALSLVDTSEEAYPGERAHNEITRGGADGIIIHGSSVNEQLAQEISSTGFPHIVIGCPEYSDNLCWIDINHVLEGEYAAAHMVECNYKDVVFICGKEKNGICAQRLKGFRKKMLNSGIHIPKDNIWYTNPNQQNAYEITRNNLKTHRNENGLKCPQAVICENSAMASSIMRALFEAGLSIPEDIAFLGFDQYPYTSLVYPVPTVINIDVFDLGVQAGEMMIRKLENPNLLIQSYTTLPCLMQGASTVVAKS
ncbi:MAG: LacI family DNA-binding transcriptional regulator [Agathobacter sp.]|nr:LacI family DNA-binding transcriptional regulator [Agathobacter sp.]